MRSFSVRPAAGPRGRAAALGPVLAGVLGCALALPAAALPMATQGFWMVMGDANAGDSELSANYALTSRDAIGGAIARFESPGHGAAMAGDRRESATLTYTRLVKRWNMPSAQANLWFVGQAGGLRAMGLGGAGRSDSRALWSPAVLADWETTRLYAGGGLKTQRAGSWRRDTAYARTGFSFYEVEYEEVQPWFILEVKRESERIPLVGHGPHTAFHRAAETEWMPMLRFIHRRWFVELGVNREGGMFNLMFNH